MGAEARRGAHSPGAAPRLGFPALPPGCQHASSSELRAGTRSFPDSKKPFLVSHLYFDSAGGKTAFLVSQETVLHVGLTSRRGDVTTHAARQRGSRTPLRRPGPSSWRKLEASWLGVKEPAQLTLDAVSGRQGGRGGPAGGRHFYVRMTVAEVEDEVRLRLTPDPRALVPDAPVGSYCS